MANDVLTNTPGSENLSPVGTGCCGSTPTTYTYAGLIAALGTEPGRYTKTKVLNDPEIVFAGTSSILGGLKRGKKPTNLVIPAQSTVTVVVTKAKVSASATAAVAGILAALSKTKIPSDSLAFAGHGVIEGSFLFTFFVPPPSASVSDSENDMARQPSDALAFPRLPAIPVAAFSEEFQPTIEAFNQASAEWYEKINGRLSVGSKGAWSGHIDGEIIEVVTPGANVDFPIPHGLERTPMGFLPLDANTSSPLFRNDSTPAHNSTVLWVRTAAVAGSRYLIWVV